MLTERRSKLNALPSPSDIQRIGIIVIGNFRHRFNLTSIDS